MTPLARRDLAELLWRLALVLVSMAFGATIVWLALGGAR